jgi:hypothetical protein
MQHVQVTVAWVHNKGVESRHPQGNDRGKPAMGEAPTLTWGTAEHEPDGEILRCPFKYWVPNPVLFGAVRIPNQNSISLQIFVIPVCFENHVATCVPSLRIPIPVYVFVCFGERSIWMMREGESWILMALRERREESKVFERIATLQHWHLNFAFSTAKGLGAVLTSAR